MVMNTLTWYYSYSSHIIHDQDWSAAASPDQAWPMLACRPDADHRVRNANGTPYTVDRHAADRDHIIIQLYV